MCDRNWGRCDGSASSGSLNLSHYQIIWEENRYQPRSQSISGLNRLQSEPSFGVLIDVLVWDKGPLKKRWNSCDPCIIRCDNIFKLKVQVRVLQVLLIKLNWILLLLFYQLLIVWLYLLAELVEEMKLEWGKKLEIKISWINWKKE